jgi:hypothetical protein
MDKRVSISPAIAVEDVDALWIVKSILTPLKSGPFRASLPRSSWQANAQSRWIRTTILESQDAALLLTRVNSRALCRYQGQLLGSKNKQT